MFKNAAIIAIRHYQKNWASRFGDICVFEPSCSHFGIEAFETYGFCKGAYKTVTRLLRCMPPNGGYDPVN